MKNYLPRNLSIGMILLAVWLIATGALPFLGIGSPALGTLLNALAIAAGVCILIGK
jgi:hypothetical protein